MTDTPVEGLSSKKAPDGKSVKKWEELKNIIDEMHGCGFNQRVDCVKGGDCQELKSFISKVEQSAYQQGFTDALETGGSITIGYTKIHTQSDKTKKGILDKLIKLAEQRGYERAKRELQPIYGGQG